MKSFKRLSCLLLALFMSLLSLAVLSACSNNEENQESTSDDSTVSDTAAETDPVSDALDALRQEVDWGGNEFGILYVNDIAGYTEEVEADEKADESTSSGVINNAVHERNTLFEEYGNLEFVLIPASNSSISGLINAEVQSGSGDFQLITQTTSATATMATSGSLYNYLDLSIDYEQSWWDKGTLEFALNGRVFFMNGPFNIVDDDVTFVMMFNKQLREDYKVENPYDTVKNKKWTLSYFNSVISALSNESSGDGKWDENDTYGFSAPGSIGNTFFYGAGLQYVVNDRNMDAPELVLTGSKMNIALDVLDIARSIVHDNHSSYIATQGSEALSKQVFVAGRSLFYCEAASYLRALNTSMETEYGVLPIPKYSEDQENYTTWSHSIGSTLSIPTSAAKNDMEQFANVLELYTVLSQKLVRPAYYDTMLTTRNVRDAESAEMVDLIFEHRTYDMAMYFDTLGLSSIFSDSVSGANTFSSAYSGKAKVFNKVVSRLLTKLQ